jgi:pilus assembly protein Flp/PilA
MGDVVLRNRSKRSHVPFAESGVTALRSSAADERGQGLAEYGLILGLIAILCIVAVLFLSGNLQGLLSNVGNSI